MYQNLSRTPFIDKIDGTIESRQLDAIVKALDEVAGVMGGGTGPGTGFSTEAKQDDIITELQSIIAQIAGTVDIEEILLEDSGAPGTFFLRRVTVDQDTGNVTISFTDLTGNPYSPVGSGTPVMSTDYEITQTTYQVTTAGTGYAIGDIIKQMIILDTGSNNVTGNIFYNLNTSAVVTPALSELELWNPASGLVPDVYNQVSIAYTTGGPSGLKEPLTVTYRNNGVVVATLTITHDVDGDITDVLKS